MSSVQNPQTSSHVDAGWLRTDCDISQLMAVRFPNCYLIWSSNSSIISSSTNHPVAVIIYLQYPYAHTSCIPILWWLTRHEMCFYISSLHKRQGFSTASSCDIPTAVPRWSFLHLIRVESQLQRCLCSLQIINEIHTSTSKDTHYLAIPNNLHVFSQKLVAHTVLATNKINEVQKFIWS